jgi:Ca-activated chloride channel family protein
VRRLTGLVILAFLLGVSATSARQLTFRSGVDLTTFGVTVLDRKGNLVTDLDRDDFEVLEDGKRQNVQFFARGDGDTSPELHLGLVLDTSGSMTDELKLARSAAVRFLNLVPEAVDITLVDFDTQVRITRYPQRDFARMVERIRMRKAEGLTALYDALGTYLDGAESQPGRKIMVMYTDGGDTRSALSFTETVTLLKASQVTVYAIGLVERTGSDEKVLAEIKGQYHLGYLSTNTSTNGAWRKVEVKTTRPDLKVRSRKGYFGPFKKEPPGH